MDSLEKVRKEISACQKCPLSKKRNQTVAGEGNPKARIMLIGEGPGFHEDQRGIPFCGQAGKLLDELLASIDLKREEVFITNVVKCRPPQNRDPEPQEIQACNTYLDRQIELINPRAIVTLGRFSMAKFLKNVYISRVHGKVYQVDNRIVIPMYHPAAGLRRGEIKEDLFVDFQKIPWAIEKMIEKKIEQEKQNDQLGLFE